MRYDDASHTGFSTAQASDIEARDDTDALAAGQRSAATGNVISGSGTETGATGADQNAADARIVEIAGSQGADSSFAGGRLSANGQFGTLTIDADGNYRYVANEGTPENSRDRFVYTLADNEGHRDSAAITFEIGKTQVKIQANAQEVIVGPDGVVVLPAGVQLSDVHVVGRDLVIDLPGGGQMVIKDGAVFVPQLVLDGVEVPATNLAALLISSEPRPAAGEMLPSSGGPPPPPVPPLDPGVPLGDLIPPTETRYTPPEIREEGQFIDREPEIFIQPDGQPAAIAAVDSVDEKGLPTGALPNRGTGEPAGSGEIADGNGTNASDQSEITTGTIIYDSPDGVDSIMINGFEVLSVDQVIVGQYGNLVITSIAPGAIGYRYTLRDNTSGDNTEDNFSVSLTDGDGDVATATLTIDIIDDVPIARPDTDTVPAGTYGPATGNVITDAALGDNGDGDTNAADTVGADNAVVAGVAAGNTGVSLDSAATVGAVVQGTYGKLTLNADGSYSYTRDPNTGGGVTDVFTYTLKDGDSDLRFATLTITIENSPPTIKVVDNTPEDQGDAIVYESDLPARPGEPAGSNVAAPSSPVATGNVNFTSIDGVKSLSITLPDGTVVPLNIATLSTVDQTVVDNASYKLVITDYGYNSGTGVGFLSYEFTLKDNTLGNQAVNGGNTIVSFGVSVTDLDDDVATDALDVLVVDDAPTANDDTGTQNPENTPITVNVFANDVPGADGVDIDNNPAVKIELVAGTLSGTGTLVNNNDGTFTYTPSAGEEGEVKFDYRITDGDGDSDVATVTITLQPDSTPEVGRAPGLTLDEDGFNFANVDANPLQANPAETDSTEALTQSSTVTVDFGNDVPANLLASITLVDTAALDGQLQLLNGAPVTFELVSGVLVGKAGDVEVIRVSITNAVAGPNTGEVTYTYQAQLLQPLEHAAGSGENSDLLSGVTFQVTDSDTDTATGSFNVTVFDDVPTANPDVDSVTEDGPTLADGNVLTGANVTDANNTDGVADQKGADGGAVTGVAFGQNVGTLGSPLDGAYGKLTLSADGTYSYQLTNGNPTVQALGVGDTLTEIFTYTLTDGDGDVSTTTLTITINGANDLPTGAAGTAVVSEEGLTGGVPDSDPVPTDNSNSATDFTGDLNFVDPDGDAVTYSLGTPVGTFQDAAGNNITWSNNGTTLIASSSAGEVIRVVIDANTGEYDVTLTRGMNHGADGNTESEFNIVVPVTVSDGTGTVPTSITVSVEDDKPVITRSTVPLGTLSVDETTLGSDDTESFASAFTVQFGGDGAKTGTNPVYTLGINAAGADSGLDDTATSQSILLYMNGTTVEGRIGGENGAVAFIVSVDANGVVTLDQKSAVVHDPNVNANDVETLANANLVTLTATATDKDNDTASLTINIGDKLNFVDDGPTLDVSLTDNASNRLVTSDANTIGNNSDTVTSAAAFNDALVVNTANYGNDGPFGGAPQVNSTYSLSLLVAEGTNSGLTSGGTAIKLYFNAGVVTGSTATSEGLIDPTNTIFTISTTTDGQVTLTQYAQIDHTNTDPSPTETPFSDHPIDLPSGLVQLNVSSTIKDGDNDVATDPATLDLGGNIRFLDHGPTAQNDTDAIAAGFFGTATGNVLTAVEGGNVVEDANGSDGVADNVGADTPGRVSQVTFQSDFGGAPVVVSIPAGGSNTIAGDYGVLTLYANGDYSYDRNDGSAGGVNDVFTYTLRDFDGDTVTATLTINIAVNPPVATTAAATVDDDGLLGSPAGLLEAGNGDINANVGDADGASSSEASFKGTLGVTGGDGDIDFNLVAPGAGITVGQETVSITGTGSLLTATITASPDMGRVGTTLFTVSLDQEFGTYTVTLVDNVLHGDDANDNEDGIEVQVTIPYNVIDASGNVSASNGVLTISFNDDTPTNNANGTFNVTVHEDALNTVGVAVGNSTGEGAKTATATITSAQLLTLVNPGADAPVSFALNSALVGADSLQGDATGLFQGGVSITWNVVSDTQIDGVIGGNVIFSIVDNPNDTFTFTLKDNIDSDGNNATGTTDDFLTDLSLAGVFTATDSDGDKVIIDTGAVVKIENDIPVNNGGVASITVHEDALNTVGVAVGNSAGEAGVKTTTGSFTVAQLQALVSPGADAPVTIGLNADIEGVPTGETQRGVSIVWDYVSPNQVRGVLVSDPTKVIFTLTYDAVNSEYDFVLLDNIDNDNDNNLTTGHGDDDVDGLSLANVFTATDSDGDKIVIDGGATVNIENDVPTAKTVGQSPLLTAIVDEDDLPTGNNNNSTGDDVPTNSDGDGDFTTTGGASGSLDALFNPGADAPLSYSLNTSTAAMTAQGLTSGGKALVYVANAGTGTLTAYADNDSSGGFSAGDTTVFIFTVNANGSWVFNLEGKLDHPAGNNENNKPIDLSSMVRAVDTDGDPSTANAGAFVISVDDDLPVVTLALKALATLVIDETDGVTANAFETDTLVDGHLGQAVMAAGDLFTSTVSAGADGATSSYAFVVGVEGTPSGLLWSANNDPIVLKYVSPTLIEGHVLNTAGPIAFTLAIDASGQVTMTQFLAVEHPTGGTSSYDELTSATGLTANAVQVVRTAIDGDSDSVSSPAVDLGSIIRFEDDGPALSFGAPNPVVSKTATGTMNLNLGSDQWLPATLVDTFINVTANGGTVGTTPVALTSFVVNPVATVNTSALATYSFTFSYDSDPVAAGIQAANGTGSITINKGTGQYSVTIDQSVGYASTVQTSQALSITAYQAELPADDQGAQAEFAVSQLAPNFFVQFYGDHNGLSYAGGSNSPFLGNPGYVSVSGDANGVNSDTIQQNDVLNLDFFTADPGGDSTPEQPRALAEAVFFQIDLFGNGEDGFVVLKLVDPNNPNTIIYRTFQANTTDFYTIDTGSPAGYNFTFDQNDAVLVIEANDYRLAGDPVPYVIAGLQYVVSSEGTSGFAYDLNGATGAGGGLIDLTANAFGPGDVTDDNDVTKIVNIGFKLTTNTPQPITLNFNVTATDADNDSTTNVPLSVTFPASVMPVALDMDGDGVEFLDTGAGAAYAYDGVHAVDTAWVGADDGILVRDANGNGSVDSASEFVFGGNGVTDLEALAAQYGSTLDVNDADFAKFGVWQDANSNGVFEAGEFTSLTALGIASINLISDGNAYSAAGGDVQVAGSSTYVRTDGSTGTVADAAFAVGSAANDQRALNGSTSNIALAAAVAAAGLSAAPAAASPDDGKVADDSAVTGQDANVASAVATSDAEAGGDSNHALTNETKVAADPAEADSSSGAGHQAANDEGDLAGDSHPAVEPQVANHGGEDAGPADQGTAQTATAPDVAMPDAAVLQANLTDGGQKNGVVEKVLADALGHDAAPTVDGLLAALGGGKGLGELAAIDHSASPADAGVPGWDMAANGASGPVADMMFKMDVAMLHHDAVQPAVNG